MTSPPVFPDRMRPALRAVRASDAEALCCMANMPGYRRGTLRRLFETVELWQKRIANSAAESAWIVAEATGGSSAMALSCQEQIRVSPTSAKSRWVDDGFVGRGIGSAILAALLEVADNWRALKRIELDVYADNEPAIRLYTRQGFVIEGRRVKAGFTDGQYLDTLPMARLHF